MKNFLIVKTIQQRNELQGNGKLSFIGHGQKEAENSNMSGMSGILNLCLNFPFQFYAFMSSS